MSLNLDTESKTLHDLEFHSPSHVIKPCQQRCPQQNYHALYLSTQSLFCHTLADRISEDRGNML